MQTLTKLIKDALSMPDDVLTYELSVCMRQMYPDKYILETEDYDFDLKAFVEAGLCRVRLSGNAHAQLEAKWTSRQQGGTLAPRNGFEEIWWQGNRFDVLVVTYGSCETKRYYIASDSPAAAKEFFARVCLFSSEVRGEILVYRNGHWQKDKGLLSQIARTTLDSLILTDELRAALTEDLANFFEARESYERLGVAWKRGILLLGPPGNGKTHAIKAMVNRLGKPCLYVRSFKSARGTIHGNIEHVFHRARQAAPCMLVMEDLDTLVDKDNLSFFLNEMDGFAANRGVLTVATTNHPEKLDSAILDRPSRFDRKLTFELPALPERQRFMEEVNRLREAELRLSSADIDAIAEKTEGFSFAYLKELWLSGMMAWMREQKPGGMAEAMTAQLEALRSQMKTEPPKAKPEDDEDDD